MDVDGEGGRCCWRQSICTRAQVSSLPRAALAHSSQAFRTDCQPDAFDVLPGLRKFLEQDWCDVARLLGNSCCPKFSYPSLCILRYAGLGTGQGRPAAQLNQKYRLIP